MATNNWKQVKGKQSVVLFDGVCHFCNSSVNFIMDRDPKNKFVFAPLQSQVANDILLELGGKKTLIYSIILIQDNRIYKRSRASLEIVRQLNGLWPLLYVFIIVPDFIRDIIYNFIAKNRYKWFGKLEACRVPKQEERERFLN
jgi:predicted DCC family thiol-disulfide oxidoreductase YuxK